MRNKSHDKQIEPPVLLMLVLMFLFASVAMVVFGVMKLKHRSQQEDVKVTEGTDVGGGREDFSISDYFQEDGSFARDTVSGEDDECVLYGAGIKEGAVTSNTTCVPREKGKTSD